MPRGCASSDAAADIHAAGSKRPRMTDKAHMRKVLFALIKTGVTGLLLWLLAREIDPEDIARRLGGAWTPGLLIGLAVVFAQLFFNAGRWQRLARMDGVTLPYAKAFRFYLEAMFFNQALPGTIGGDVMRIHWVRGYCRGLGQAVNGVLLDRLIGLIGLTAMIAVGLSLLPVRAGAQSLLTGLVVVAGAGLAGVALVLMIAHLPEDGAGGAPRVAAVRFAKLFDRLARHPRQALPILGLALMTHAATVAMAAVCARALGLPFGFLDCLVVVPTSGLIATLLISLGGWGVREGAMAAGFMLIGGTPADGAALSIVIGLILLTVGIVGGAVWFVSGADRPHEATPAESER